MFNDVSMRGGVQFGKMTLRKNEIKGELKDTANADEYYKGLEQARKNNADLIQKLENAGLDIEVGSGLPPSLKDRGDEMEGLRFSFINNRTGKTVDSLFQPASKEDGRRWTPGQTVDFMLGKALLFLDVNQTEDGPVLSPRTPLDKTAPEYSDTDIVAHLKGSATDDLDEARAGYAPLTDRLEAAGVKTDLEEAEVLGSDYAYRGVRLNLTDTATGDALNTPNWDTPSKKTPGWWLFHRAVHEAMGALGITPEGKAEVTAKPIGHSIDYDKLKALIPEDGTRIEFDWVDGEPVLREPAAEAEQE